MWLMVFKPKNKNLDFWKKFPQFLIFCTIFGKYNEKNRKFSKIFKMSKIYFFCLNTIYNTEKDIYSPTLSFWTCLAKIVRPIETSELALFARIHILRCVPEKVKKCTKMENRVFKWCQIFYIRVKLRVESVSGTFGVIWALLHTELHIFYLAQPSSRQSENRKIDQKHMLVPKKCSMHAQTCYTRVKLGVESISGTFRMIWALFHT